jgi:hypothetical protein
METPLGAKPGLQFDPKQTLLNARDALLRGDRDEARRLTREYFAWRNRGGSEPTLTFPGRTFYSGTPYTVDGSEYARAIANSANRKMKNPSLEVPAFLTFEVTK